MSWLFGSSSSSKEQSYPTKSESLSEGSAAENALGFDPASVQDVSSFLTPDVLDTTQLHPLAGLGQTLEYLDIEDDALTNLSGGQGLLPSRGWTDDLCYGTGTVYLLGLGVGGAYGLSEGIRNIPPNAPGRIKLNTILNAITKRGPFLGNSAGVLAVTYNLINSTIGYIRGKHEDINSIGSGMIAGAIFKSSKGLKPMGIASGLMGLAAGSWCLFKRAVSP